jgi:hypothetical protein
MTDTALQIFAARIRAGWGPLSSALAAACRHHMETLMQAPETEPWLADLHKAQPASRELYRDPTHGFVLLAHTEPAGLYRPPHDHGRGWVIYAVQRGAVEMGTYARIEDGTGNGNNGSRAHLVKRDATVVHAGQAKLFLPGDIHDTRCLSGPALLFRFTDRDLKKEDQEEHRVTRYTAEHDVWTTSPA